MVGKEKEKEDAVKHKDKETKDLEKQDFFHGFRPRRDIAKLVREPGEFLVRVTDGRGPKIELVLTVMSTNKELVHLTLKFENGQWSLGILKNLKKNKKQPPQFGHVVDLINHYKANNISKDIKLVKVVPRPTWLIQHDQIVFDKEKDFLGGGNFCNVYKGTYHQTAEERLTVAVKICHESASSNKDFEDGREARNSMIAEAQLMSYYLHEHVIKFYGVSCDRPPVLIVLDYCPGGNLGGHLEKMGDKIETGERLVYAMEAARGMRYLHSNGCVHRDLAARNCLISANGLIKIADFGLSKLVTEQDTKTEVPDVEQSQSLQIPMRWMAPESLTKPMKFSYKSDVWSFGVLVYEVFNNGAKPFPDDPPKKYKTLIKKGLMPPMPEKTPPDIKELMAAIWVVDPESRPEMRKVCTKIFTACSTQPAPPDKKWSINGIPGVTRHTPVDIVPLQEETNDEDETGATRNSLELKKEKDEETKVSTPKKESSTPPKKELKNRRTKPAAL